MIFVDLLGSLLMIDGVGLRVWWVGCFTALDLGCDYVNCHGLRTIIFISNQGYILPRSLGVTAISTTPWSVNNRALFTIIDIILALFCTQ